MKKFKILMLADNPLNTSGVGCQARHLIEGMLKKDRWKFLCLGGAIRHEDYTVQVVDGNPDFVVKPVDGFGTPEMLRQILVQEKPDALFLFTDPRFFLWAFEIEDDIHQICPIVYWHVWDNDPWPEFNRVLYESTDLINCHSYLTYGMVHERFPEKTNFIPHALPDEVFKPLPAELCVTKRRELIGPERDDHFICIWVNRNARRKMPGNVMLSWKLFLDTLEATHGHRKATLLMHTNPYDQEGQNLPNIAEAFGITDSVIYSAGRISFDEMAVLYNISDIGVNIACLPGDELVMTRNGMQEIQNIEVGTDVLTHRGRYRPVLNVWQNPRSFRSVYEIKTTNNSPVHITGNHKIKAIKKNDLPKNFLFNENLHCVLDYVKFHSIEDLAIGDYVVQYCDDDEFQDIPHVIDLWDLVKDDLNKWKKPRFRLNEISNSIEFQYTNRHPTICKSLIINEDIAYMIGRWNADGSSGTTSIIFNGAESADRKKLTEIYDRYFGGHTERHRNDNAKCVDVGLRGVTNGIMTKFFATYCGHGSEFKRIPEFIFTSPEPVRRAYLEGHFGGDGCELTHPTQGNKKKRIRTISNSLARGLKRLLIGLGYVPFVKRDVNGGTWAKKLIWTIEWRESRQHSGSSRMWNVDGRALISRIYGHKIDETYSDEIVYDLNVDEDHTYTTEMATVHNCHEGYGLATLETMQCGKPIIALKTGGLTRQVVDHRDGSQNGVALDPDVRDLVGGQMVPYIYEDHVAPQKVADAIWQLYDMPTDDRKKLGLKARDYVLSEMSLQKTIDDWDETLYDTITRWKSDKASMYTPWTVKAL